MSAPDVHNELYIDTHIIDSYGFSSHGIHEKRYHTGSETPETPVTPVTPHEEFMSSGRKCLLAAERFVISDEMAPKLNRIVNAYNSIYYFEKNKNLDNDAENVGTMIARMKWYKNYKNKYENKKEFEYFWVILSDIIKIQAMLINQRQPKEISIFIEEVFIKGYFVLTYECWGEQRFQEIMEENSYEIKKFEIFIDMYKEIASIVKFINIMTTIYVNANGVSPRALPFFEKIPKGVDFTSIMNQCREVITNEDIFGMDNELNNMANNLKFLRRRLAEIAEMNNVDVESKSGYLKALENSYSDDIINHYIYSVDSNIDIINDYSDNFSKNQDIKKYYYERIDKKILMDLLNQIKEEMRREELKIKRNNDLDKLKKISDKKLKEYS
ncbi:3690_t:CDS:1 [Scutellospora calospora]|uniref:3690_t:CDS:1 n=1 Tax=Scutellospora calospora TaxID=85575 RepID=A0ACA9LLJ7_9GLOM|nr:3690_t:CDS:1 [Scutellospora calospora]